MKFKKRLLVWLLRSLDYTQIVFSVIQAKSNQQVSPEKVSEYTIKDAVDALDWAVTTAQDIASLRHK